MKEKQVVITGADGYIGSHLVKAFVQKGWSVTALIMSNSPTRSRIEEIPHVNIVEGDINQWKTFVDAVPQHPEAFFHLAWAGVAPKDRNTMDIQLPNIEMCLNMVRLAAGVHAKRFILPGSTMEYAYCGQPVHRMASPSPQNVYGAAKVSARYLCEALSEELDLPFIYAVITGIYSADRIDNNVIFYTISSLLEKKEPQLTSLEQRWDYVHIDDAINALTLIAEKGKKGGFYGIGHGDKNPLAHYIYQIRDIINPNIHLGIGTVPYKDDRIPSSCVDMTSLIEDTGYHPQISFEEGIRDTIEQVRRAKKL